MQRYAHEQQHSPDAAEPAKDDPVTAADKKKAPLFTLAAVPKQHKDPRPAQQHAPDNPLGRPEHPPQPVQAISAPAEHAH